MEARKHHWVLSLGMSSIYFEAGSLIAQELTNQGRLTSQAPGSLLPLPPQRWDHRWAPPHPPGFLCKGWESKLRSSESSSIHAVQLHQKLEAKKWTRETPSLQCQEGNPSCGRHQRREAGLESFCYLLLCGLHELLNLLRHHVLIYAKVLIPA